ncbi:MAG: hypothetical protein ACI4D3_10230 [Lachnospiraceae bacterium]
MSDRKKGRKMTFRQIIAWIAIILLVGIYVVTLICSLIDSPLAEQMFHASLYCTFFIPVMSWVFIMTVKLVKGNAGDETHNEDRSEDQKEKK